LDPIIHIRILVFEFRICLKHPRDPKQGPIQTTGIFSLISIGLAPRVCRPRVCAFSRLGAHSSPGAERGQEQKLEKWCRIFPCSSLPKPSSICRRKSIPLLFCEGSGLQEMGDRVEDFAADSPAVRCVPDAFLRLVSRVRQLLFFHSRFPCTKYVVVVNCFSFTAEVL
jgi:hypothetical protein